MPASGEGDSGSVANGLRTRLAGLGRLARYGVAWPIFMHREAVTAYDNALAFWLRVILGDGWDDGGHHATRRARRPAG